MRFTALRFPHCPGTHAESFGYSGSLQRRRWELPLPGSWAHRGPRIPSRLDPSLPEGPFLSGLFRHASTLQPLPENGLPSGEVSLFCASRLWLLVATLPLRAYQEPSDDFLQKLVRREKLPSRVPLTPQHAMVGINSGRAISAEFLEKLHTVIPWYPRRLSPRTPTPHAVDTKTRGYLNPLYKMA